MTPQICQKVFGTLAHNHLAWQSWLVPVRMERMAFEMGLWYPHHIHLLVLVTHLLDITLRTSIVAY